MKRASTSILSILMVIAILVNTAGVTVYNHFCSKEGESSLSFTKQENCCENKHESKKREVKQSCCSKKENKISEKKKGCCSQDAFTAQWKIDSYSFKKNIFISSSIISLLVIIPKFRLNILSTDLIAEINSPPLIIPPVDILHLHSVLII